MSEFEKFCPKIQGGGGNQLLYLAELHFFRIFLQIYFLPNHHFVQKILYFLLELLALKMWKVGENIKAMFSPDNAAISLWMGIESEKRIQGIANILIFSTDF